MNLPKTIKDYCRKCKKHTEHKLKQFKPGSPRPLAEGNRKNVEKKRGYKGKYQFPAKVKKQNKKPTFIAECTACKAKHYFVIPKRMKKVELVAKESKQAKSERQAKGQQK
ncbi:MAG: 50S ribosomal protein L44e [Candidatus Diapherotrites archaeon]|uniref:50S ribosomal protein L44e n=1 Tax=Candidatus Iainarchaeum sp. TaxID=3101447 RepID=A0A938YU84_9ARCH|nr:50S ribosomal protein L44e [Candidatus Diapherotrites archaeon]